MGRLTFMIGNGFDLACGLNSRFEDTYDGYVHTASSSKAIKKFKGIIDANLGNWSDFEMALAKYAQCFQDEAELVECVCDYTEYLTKHLIKEQEDFVSKHMDNSFLAEILSNEMQRSLSLENFYGGLTRNSEIAIQSALRLDEKPLLTSRRYVSFNYTDVFDRILDMLPPIEPAPVFNSSKPQKPSVLHIHGKLSKGGVILGLDNEVQISGLPYNLSDNGKMCLVKPTMTDNSDHERKSKTLRIIKESDVICIYGLSLGESDLTWKNAIAEWLRADATHQLVYYEFTLSQKANTTLHSYVLKMTENKAKYDLAQKLFGDNLPNAIVESQIHIPVGYNIFNFKKAIENGYA